MSNWHPELDFKYFQRVLLFFLGTPLVQRYFQEPYRFIPPYRSTIWCRIASHIVPSQIRKREQIQCWKFQGLEQLEQSLEQKAGVVLASNHCRNVDPMMLGILGFKIRKFCYFVVSYHLFKSSRLKGWFINRLGGYSIHREGTDRESIRTTASLLAEGNRPVVLFPEGTWFRQNDRLGPLQDGVSLMVRQAAKQTDRPILIHPIALKYWALKDPRPELQHRLAQMETRMGWHPQSHLDLLSRLEKLCSALLAIKEIEILGKPGFGLLDERVQHLAASLVTQVEQKLQHSESNGPLLERIRRIRVRLVKQLSEEARDKNGTRQTRQFLDQLLLAENLNSHSMEYLVSQPSLERMIETVQRIEETVYDDGERSIVPHGVVIAVGPAIDVRSEANSRTTRGSPDPLMQKLSRAIQELLDQLLRQGPPPEWNCPSSGDLVPSSSLFSSWSGQSLTTPDNGTF